MKSVRHSLCFVLILGASAMTGALPAVATSAAAGEIERAFQVYTQKMQVMAKDCQKTNQEESMKCVCSYMKELFAFKALVEKAAQTAPDDVVTFRVKDKKESVTIGKLAKDMQKTEKMTAMCADPAATVKKLTNFKAQAMQLSAKAMLRNIQTMQQTKMAEAGKFVDFSAVGAGTKKCKVDSLDLEVLSCDKTVYFYTAKTSEDGKTFTAEARTQTGKDHGIFPGCETPDIWTIDDKGSLRHVLNAEEKC